ncbi:tetratricopeptide repeat protein [Lichenifustis flavocetrariae]|uniref:Tetratricopeptide repeat protein n=1 Tax=Lichenifustis flavocetrariae TaxID=2949735 RepID=A0AA42CMU3_9HYPH|nr:tetratricopeptide repeat protein [Lichenifustis flavocetrariae]MCW6511941.1 tetratricopeptide repeat protein [Lichenifustis flavocetrariae]
MPSKGSFSRVAVRWFVHSIEGSDVSVPLSRSCKLRHAKAQVGDPNRKKRMLRVVRTLGFGGLLALSACQTPPDAVSASGAGPDLDAAPLASDELSRLGRQDLTAGNSGLAEEHFRSAVEKNRANYDAWVGLAAAYDNLKRFELADRAYAEAIRLRGETFWIMNNIGYSYYLRGDRKRALSELERAASLSPNNAVVENNISLVRTGDQPNRRAAP